MPGTQVAGGTKHWQGVPRAVPGVTGQVLACVTHTFEGAADSGDGGDEGPDADEDAWASISTIAAMQIMSLTSPSSPLRCRVAGAGYDVTTSELQAGRPTARGDYSATAIHRMPSQGRTSTS
jgi:hypothetical protein